MMTRLLRGLPIAATGVAFASAAVAKQPARSDDDSSTPSQLFSAHVTGLKEVATTRWLRLQTACFKDQQGRPREWDMVSRTTRAADSSIDGVVIVPLLHKRGSSADVETLVVLQFRPPVARVTAELPAGLVDQGETAEMAALRELKEETGYSGVVSHTSGLLSNAPFLINDTEKMVVVQVDLDAPENRLPCQALEDDEFISVRRVKLRDLQGMLAKLESTDGVITAEGLRLLAVGWQLHAQFAT